MQNFLTDYKHTGYINTYNVLDIMTTWNIPQGCEVALTF